MWGESLQLISGSRYFSVASGRTGMLSVNVLKSSFCVQCSVFCVQCSVFLVSEYMTKICLV